MSAQRRPATKRDASGSGSRRSTGGGRQGGSGSRTATVSRQGDATADVVAASGANVAAAPPPRSSGGTASPVPAKTPKPAPAKSKEPDSKPNAFAERGNRVRKIYDDTRAEMKKITWPDKETTRNLAIVVIGISVVLGILLGGIDYVLFQVFEALP